MSDRLASVCGVLGGGLDDPVTLACLVPAAGLVGSIGAGFGALRTTPGARPAGAQPGDGGLFDLWRLGRQLGGAAPSAGRSLCTGSTSVDRTRVHRSTAAAA